MSYVLEKITREMRGKVDADAGPRLAQFMERRSFWESDGDEIERHWAIDHVSGNYLMNSPSFYNVFRAVCWYYFNFHSKIYCFRIRSSSQPMVDFYDAKPSSDLYSEFKQELTKAFAVHGQYGPGVVINPALVPDFPQET